MYTKISLYDAVKIQESAFLIIIMLEKCYIFCTTLSVNLSKTVTSCSVKIVKKDTCSLLEKHYFPVKAGAVNSGKEVN